jgi:hypothetical protein
MSARYPNGRDPYEAYIARREQMRQIADQLRDLKAKYADVTNPNYTELSPLETALLRSSIQALEAKLTLLATTPYNDERTNEYEKEK